MKRRIFWIGLVIGLMIAVASPIAYTDWDHDVYIPLTNFYTSFRKYVSTMDLITFVGLCLMPCWFWIWYNTEKEFADKWTQMKRRHQKEWMLLMKQEKELYLALGREVPNNVELAARDIHQHNCDCEWCWIGHTVPEVASRKVRMTQATLLFVTFVTIATAMMVVPRLLR